MHSEQWNEYKKLGLKGKLLILMGGLLVVSLTFISVLSNMYQDTLVVPIFVGSIVFLVSLVLMNVVLSNILKPMTMLLEASEKLAQGDKDAVVEIVSGDEFGQLAFSLSKIKENIDILSKSLDDISSDVDVGNLFSRIEEPRLKGKYRSMVDSVNDIVTDLVAYMDELTISILITDREYKIRYINKFTLNLMGNPPLELILGKRCHDIFNTEKCNSEQCPLHICMKTGKSSAVNNTTEMAGNTLHIQNFGIPVRNKKGELVSALEITYDTSEIVSARQKAEKMLAYQEQEVERLISKMSTLAKGNLDIQADVGAGDESTVDMYRAFKKLNDNLQLSASTIKSYIDELNNVLNEMSHRNLNISIDREYIGDFVTIKNSINDIVHNFNKVFTGIQTSSGIVHKGSTDVSEVNNNLTVGLDGQANSVAVISEAITNVSVQTKKNADNSLKAKELSDAAKTVAENGNTQMSLMVSAMDDIKKSSGEISKIIKVINDIAFQTNLLALNAAVEAARAGQHGKGFAVVAEEVRNLAARSATAAKETTVMIDNSLRKVDIGSGLAHDTSEMLSEIVTSVTDAAQIVSEISKESYSQTTELSRIEESILQILEVTQTNLALLQQNSRTSEELTAQALSLDEVADQFKLRK